MFSQPLAYIDPGVASILLQVIMSVCLGAGIFFRRSFARVYYWLRRDKQHRDPEGAGVSREAG